MSHQHLLLHLAQSPVITWSLVRAKSLNLHLSLLSSLLSSSPLLCNHLSVMGKPDSLLVQCALRLLRAGPLLLECPSKLIRTSSLLGNPSPLLLQEASTLLGLGPLLRSLCQGPLSPNVGDPQGLILLGLEQSNLLLL